MWEHHKDPKHPYRAPTGAARIATTKAGPDERPAGTEGLCWSRAVHATDLAAGVDPRTACTFQAHHVGRHSWQAAPAATT